jgi:putative sugar O-methyltransferase
MASGNLKQKIRKSNENDSDSQALGYGKLIARFSNDPASRASFRRNFLYRMILEHVSYRQGLAYSERILELGVVDYEQIKILAESDFAGNPRRYKYKNVGWVSPTLLRYISVFSEIEKSIGFKNIDSVVEIGIGYGGQARVICNLAKISNYAFYDLNDVQKLAEYFLKISSSHLSPRNLDIDSVERESFDLAISNYALSELPAHVQREYLEKVLTPARHCYMIMNSGASDLTKRSSGKLGQSDFVSGIRGVQVLPEIPSTGPDNYVLVK